MFASTPLSLPTYVGTINAYRLQYDQRLGMGDVNSFDIPANLSHYLLLVVCLVLPRNLPVRLRFPAFLAIVISSIWTARRARTVGLAYGVIVGISSSFCVIQAFNFLLLDLYIDRLKRRIPSTRMPVLDLRWQGQPTSIRERLFWTLDLLGSLRGVHWTYEHYGSYQPRWTRRRYRKAPTPLYKTVAKFFIACLSIDILKEIIALDPYFWGFIDADPPSHLKYILHFAILIKIYRLLIASTIFYVAIEMICAAGELLFVHILGPRIAGTWAHSWAYEPPFGAFKSVYKDGLRGFWGCWWHQMFRIQFTSVAIPIIYTVCEGGSNVKGRVVRLSVPFLCSGVVHACGSYTMWGDTKPINSFLFFAVQPVGIMVQAMFRRGLNKLVPFDKIPVGIRYTGNIAFMLIWLFNTFPLLADDYAKGGLFLTEPFPFSLLQAIGVGSQARSHQFWIGHGFQLRTGPEWWRVGVAF